jgi:MFS family permease
LLITGMYASFFVGVLYLQHVRRYGVLQTGLAFLPQTLVLAALSLGVTARLVNRFGSRGPLLVGLLACGAGLALLTQAGTNASYLGSVLPAFVLFGIGAGLAFMPLLTIAMAHVPAADAGMASGIVNTSLQLSGALGVAVLGTVATDRTRSLIGAGQGQISSLLGGYHLAFTVGLGCVAAAVLVTLLTIRAPARERLAPVPASEPEPTSAEAPVEWEAA